MRVHTQMALAGTILVALCGAAQAKTTTCACHLLTKNVHHTTAHRATERVSKTVRHAAASRATQNDRHDSVRAVREGSHNMRQDAAQRDRRYGSQESESNVTASRETRNDYDYYDARQTNEDIYNTRQTYAQDVQRDEQYDRRQDSYSYSYGEYRGTADGPPVALNGRDFSGGVGYGQSGDMGYYQGGYGRFDPYNGNTAGMNGGVDGARMSVWHGYNGHNGLGNGY